MPASDAACGGLLEVSRHPSTGEKEEMFQKMAGTAVSAARNAEPSDCRKSTHTIHTQELGTRCPSSKGSHFAIGPAYGFLATTFPLCQT